jgi:hypothetical protein
MKKIVIVALVVASTFVACGGKKKDNTMKPGSGSATAPAGSGDGSAAPAGGDGSAAPAGSGG